MTANATAPTAPAERIRSLDTLRGFAVLGILVMNIQSFSMISAAYFNPLAHGDMTGSNRWVYYLSHIFADSKMISIFSILFGAGVVMITGRLEKKGRGAAAVYYRRTFALVLFGCAHAYAFWYGDVLFWYGVTGLWIYFFRNLSPKWLIPIGLIFILIGSGLSVLTGFALPRMPGEQLSEMSNQWAPDEETAQAEINAYRGGWLRQMDHRAPTSFFLQTFVYFFFALWRVGGLMLIGMALHKLGVLTAERSNRFYATLAIVGFLAGFPLVAVGLANNTEAQWAFEYSKFFGGQYNYWGSLFVAIGYIGAIMLFCRSAAFAAPSKALANVGRMALTNYLLQTLICTTLFYGHGFGLFGRVDRAGQALIVICVWIVQLILSSMWLRRFRYGPAEWLWRSMAYFAFQPIRY